MDFAKALEQAQRLGLKEEWWKALYGSARNPLLSVQQSRTLLLQAVELIEHLRDSAGSTQLRSSFLADKRAVFDRLVETSQSAAEAFRWMEQSRARTLRDQSKPGFQPLATFQKNLPANTLVLEFWLGHETAAVLWITAQDAGLNRWTPDWSSLEQIRQSLADPAKANWRATLQPLSEQLLNGIEPIHDPHLTRARIIPDGPLALLPFEALPLSSGKLLVQRFAISYAPSATLSGHSKPMPRKIRWPWQPSMAAFADPSGTSQSRAWAPLPHARTEAQAAAKVTGGHTAILTGGDVQKPALLAATAFPLLHLATHAQADLQDPERSFILLASPSKEFDYLYAKEIAATSFSQTDLVTLSACETNVGVFVPGEGLRGFSEAFLAAGARSVLNSLWPVGDISTGELMTRFYTNLASRSIAAEALQQAKLDFINHPQSSHPAHWAAFVLNGDGDWQAPRLIGWPLITIAVLVLLFAAALMYLKLR